MRFVLMTIGIGLFVFLSPVYAATQSLGAIAKQTASDRAAHPAATKALTNSDLPPDPGSATALAADVPVLADGLIDQSKFEKAYEAGVAARDAMLRRGEGLALTDLQQRFVTFSTEIKLASDHASNKAEQKLAGLYQVAESNCELATLTRSIGDAATYSDRLDRAMKSLDLAESVYRSKNEPKPSPGK